MDHLLKLEVLNYTSSYFNEIKIWSYFYRIY